MTDSVDFSKTNSALYRKEVRGGDEIQTEVFQDASSFVVIITKQAEIMFEAKLDFI